MNVKRHMRSGCYLMIWGAGLLLCLPGPLNTAEAGNRTTIINVTERFEGRMPRDFGRGVQSRRLPLFMNELEVGEEHIFEVLWRPRAQGVPPGILVHFEYRHPLRRGISKMSIEYDTEVREDQIARFIVPREDVDRWGRVTAWRIRILRDDRLLAQQTSETWK